MTQYRSFSLELPSRVRALDLQMRSLAKAQDLEVTYLLMKASSAFLLPWMRKFGDSGAEDRGATDVGGWRKTLELDKLFVRSNYCLGAMHWQWIEVDGFDRGPADWHESKRGTERLTVADALTHVRHALAHANLHFGGGRDRIEDVFFGKRLDKDLGSTRYSVLKGSVVGLDRLVDRWMENIELAKREPGRVFEEWQRALAAGEAQVSV